MSNEDQRKIVDDAARRLGEFFDCVQIVVSCPTENNGTRCIKSGMGNWYARRGMCQEFCEEDSARTTAREIGEELKDPPDEGWKKT